MNKTILILSIPLLVLFSSCSEESVYEPEVIKEEVALLLDSFHFATGKLDPSLYFDFFTDDAVYFGTAPEERWSMDEFRVYIKRNFEYREGWLSVPLSRKVYSNKDVPDMAWFDELVMAGPNICRGSGVLIKRKNGWKLAQYVFSFSFPNEKIDSLVQLKAPYDKKYIESVQLKKRKSE